MVEDIFPSILSKLESAQPALGSNRTAAVAVLLAGGTSPRTLLIKRAERLDDPWSGQVAFPGGKMVKGDSSAMVTAVRETNEEIGVDLARSAKFLGYYRPFRTHTGDMDVIPAVFETIGEVKVVPNEEVSSHRWVSLKELLRPGSASTYRLEMGETPREVPSFVIGDYVVWGLTHRILSSLLGLASL